MSEVKDKLLRMVDKMPAFSNSVHRILSLANDINCSPRDLVEVIEYDPVLTMKILKLVNSAYFGLSSKITSIKHAVVFIGINTVKNLALSVAAIGTLPRENEAGFDMDEFLMHSVGTAAITKILARRQRIPESQTADFFVSGLLHDIGKVLFAHFLPLKSKQTLILSRAKKVPLWRAERAVIGADHAEVGALLAEKWKLPDNLVTSIRYHHAPLDNPNADLLQFCVTTANEIAKFLQIGDGGSPVVEQIPQEILDRFGTNFQGLIQDLPGLDAEIEKAQVFVKL
jgi:putative nucleotidyltransferase with HDIG domain